MTDEPSSRESAADFSDFSHRMEALGRKLVNVGIWPHRAKECLRRYAAERIEANFELYRERASEVEDDGAWLCAAITDGYADLEGGGPDNSRSAGGDTPNGREEEETSCDSGRAPRSDHKQKVSAEEKRTFVRQCPGLRAGDFHRFRCAEDPARKQFLYLDPSVGGPSRKGGSQKMPA